MEKRKIAGMGGRQNIIGGLSALIVAFLLSAGCNSAGSQPAIPDDNLKDILLEFHLLDARLELFDEDLEVTRDSILVAYGHTREEFDATMAYYARHPRRYVRLYDEMMSRLMEEH